MIFAIDTETTGLDPEKDRLLEIAVCTEGGPHLTMHSLISQPEPIPTMAKAITLIDDEDVHGMPDQSYVIDRIANHLMDHGCTALVAHNAQFDKGFCGAAGLHLGVPWICTYRIARHIWPDLESHGLMFLRYHLGLKISPRGHPHRALYDAHVCLAVWEALSRELDSRNLCDPKDPASVVEWQNRPVLLRTIRFGKHAGTAWDEIPRSYLQWMQKAEKEKPGSWDEDTLYTLDYYLGA